MEAYILNLRGVGIDGVFVDRDFFDKLAENYKIQISRKETTETYQIADSLGRVNTHTSNTLYFKRIWSDNVNLVESLANYINQKADEGLVGYSLTILTRGIIGEDYTDNYEALKSFSENTFGKGKRLKALNPREKGGRVAYLD